MRFPLSVALVLFVAAACSTPDPVQGDPGDGPLEILFGAEVQPEWQKILTQADRLELVAVAPDWPSEESRADPTTLHGYQVLGRAWLTDRDARLELLGAFAKGDAENDDLVAACFNPRHVVRAEFEGRWCELIICFECLSYQVWDGRERWGRGLITEAPKVVFNRIYQEAGLSVAPGG